jgi:hypothetical protein
MLVPRRHEKGKPAAQGGGAKPKGLLLREVAGLPNGGGVIHNSPGQRE